MTFKNKALALATVLAASAVAGCTAGTPSATATEPATGIDQNAEQTWALGDGKVTEQEYRKALDNFIGCMSDAGYSATKPLVSPVDGLTMLFDFKPSGDIDVYNSKLDHCNETQFSQIEPMYVEARTQAMVPELRKATADCLTGTGRTVRGGETTIREFMTSTGLPLHSVMECVSPALQRLFPELPELIKVRA